MMSKINPLRALRQRIARLPLRQRLLFTLVIPLLIGFLLMTALGLRQIRDAELRLASSEQQRVAVGITNRVTTFLQTLPETALNLADSSPLDTLLETSYRLGQTDITPLEHAEFSQEYADALSRLSAEAFDLMQRSETVESIHLLDASGQELLRVEHNDPDSPPQIALPFDLENLGDESAFQALSTRERGEVYISPVLLGHHGETGTPVVQVAVPLYYRGQPAGGILVDVRADSFLGLIDARGLFETPREFQFLLVDNAGFYLADTRDTASASQHLFGRDGITMINDDPALAALVGTTTAGAEVGDHIVSAATFDPYPVAAEGTPWTLFVLEDRRAALANVEQAALLALVTSLLITAAILLIVWQLSSALTRPLHEAAAIADRISGGDLSARIPVEGEDEIASLGQAINNMTSRLVDSLSRMEERFLERTRDLEVTSEIASSTAAISDLQTLLERTVNLVRERFDFYHVQVFLVDRSTNEAKLVASTGEAGETLLSLSWSLPVGSNSVIGQVTAKAQTVIALDTADATVPHRPNPYLPETRSEMALPMIVGEEVIGALDIQSEHPNAFGEADVRVFSVLANQLAIAVHNARLLEETHRQIERFEALNRSLTRQAWEDFLSSRGEELAAYYGTAPADDDSSIVSPIRVRGEVIGTLNVAPPDGRPIGQDEVALINAVAERVSLAVENARLFTETQQSLAETERLYQTSRAISSSTTPADITLALQHNFGMPTRIIRMVVFGQEYDQDGIPTTAHIITCDSTTDGVMEEFIDDLRQNAPLYSPQVLGETHAILTPEAFHAQLPAATAEQLLAEGVQSLAIFPIKAGEMLLGALMLLHTVPYTCSQREMEIFQALVGQAATVLRNRQLFEAVEAERKALGSVLEAQPTAVLVFDPDTFQATMANERAVQMFGQQINLHALVEEQRLIWADDGTPYPLEELPPVLAARTGQTTFSEDLAILQPNGYTVSVLSHAAPITDTAGNVTAIVNVLQDISELRDLQTALQETLHETTAMYEANRAITASQEVPDIASAVVEHLQINVPSNFTHVLVTPLDPDSEEGITVAAAYPENQGNPYPDSVLRPEGVHQVYNVPNDTALSEDERAALEANGIRALVTVPMTIGGETIGWLICGYSTPHNIPLDNLRFLEALADQAAIALQNARLKAQTEAALQQTVQLYNASREITQAQTIQQVLDTFASFTLPPEATHADIVLLESSEETTKPIPYLVASWKRSDSVSSPLSPNFVANLTEYFSLDALQQDEPIIVENIPAILARNPAMAERFKAVGFTELPYTTVTLPLSVAGQLVGALQIRYDQPIHHSAALLRSYRSLAGQVASAVETRRLLEQTQRRARQLQTSAEVSRAVTSILDIEELLPRVVNLIRDNFGYDHAQVFLVNKARTEAVLQASTGEAGKKMLELNWSLEVGSQSVIGQVTAHAQPVIALDTADAKVPHRPNPHLPDIRSEMAVPLISRGSVVGALDVQSKEPNAFTNEDVRILTSLADQIAVALDNARLFQETQEYTLALSEQVQNLQSLLEASQSFTTMLNADDILHEAARYMTELMNVDHCGIVVVPDESSTVGTVRAEYPDTGAVGTEIDMARAWWREEFERTGRPVVIPNVSESDLINEANREVLLNINVQEIVLIPFLTSGDRMLGSIGLDLYQSGREFTDQELTLLQLLATQVETAYRNAQLFEGQQAAARALEQQVNRLENLFATSQAIGATLDPDAILQIAVERLQEFLEYDNVSVAIYDDDLESGVVRASHPRTEYVSRRIAPDGMVIARHLAEQREPLLIEDMATSIMPDSLRERVQDYGIKSMAFVPLLSGDRLLGSFGLDSHIPRTFSREEVRLIQLVANQVSLAYQNARLFAQAQSRAEEMTFLFNATSAATASEDINRSMSSVAELVRQNITSDAVVVFLADAERQSLNRVAISAQGDNIHPPQSIPVATGMLREAIMQRKPIFMNNLGDNEHYRAITSEMNSLIAVPLLTGAELIGAIILFHHEQDTYNENHVRVLQALAGSLSAVVQNIRLLKEVRAANERLRELDKIKSQFLANMSHELRTPLNSIIGFSRVILKGIDGPLTDMQKQDLETIHSSGQHLLNLINDLLDQSKIEAGKMELNRTWFDLTTVIDVARSMSVGLLKDKPIRLNIELEPDLPQVWGDEIRTRQVLLNLLSNAAKFTREGSITVAAFTVQKEDGPYVQISVTDTGIGIPEDKLDTVFVAFEQVDGSLTRTSGGTGLGLPISRSLIEMQGGELWVESTLNVGSTFSFTIPAFAGDTGKSTSEDDEPESEPTAPVSVPYEEQNLPPRKIVLVIDDEIGMHQLYRRYLNKAGYTVEAISNPEQAEEFARLVKPDVIILDVRMPQRDGWDVLAKLKDSDETFEIPIIVCSIEPDSERGFRLGAAEYLTKPFLEEDLLAALRRVEAEQARGRILIIDDKPESIRLLADWLRTNGHYEILTATSGAEGLDIIAEKRPDLVLLDLNMPDMDGFEVLEQLRAEPLTRNLPVLIITAEDDMASQAQQRLSDIDIYHKSELDEVGLLTGIEGLLNNHNGENSA